MAETRRFSIREAQALVRDLGHAKPWIYWTDFLSSIIVGHVLFHAVLFAGKWMSESSPWFWPVRATLFGITVLLYSRAAMFTHELVHLPKEEFKAFRIVWNILCGIPFMIPSFTYYPHVEHHRRKHYGTEDDGEYLNLSHRPPSHILGYMGLCLFIPIAVYVRFGLVTPLCWMFPKLREWIFHRASTMVMDPSYFRPDASPAVQRIRFIQEAACFALCMFLALRGPLIRGVWFDPFWVQAYLMGLTVITMNNIRTLGAHRWTGQGEEMSFEEQLLDSLNYPYRPWITELWGPVGLRYHATHHLFPSMPYHNLGIAHRRLTAGLGPTNLYHETVRVSLLAEISSLWKRAAEAARNGDYKKEKSFDQSRAA